MLSEREKIIVSAITEQFRDEIKEASLANVFVNVDAPRLLSKSFVIDRGESVLHAGGEFIATRKSTENPDDDPLSYRVVRNGIRSIDIDVAPDRLQLEVKTSDGESHKSGSSLAIPTFCGVYDKQAEYPVGSVVIKDKRAVIKDVTGAWRLFFYIDPSEIKGEKGDKGTRGAKGESIKGDDGRDAPTIEKCYATDDGFFLELSSGKTVPMIGSKAFMDESMNGYFAQKSVEHKSFIEKVARQEAIEHAKTTSDNAIELWQKEIVRLSDERIAADSQQLRENIAKDNEEQRAKTRAALEQIVDVSLAGIEQAESKAITRLSKIADESQKRHDEQMASAAKGATDIINESVSNLYEKYNEYNDFVATHSRNIAILSEKSVEELTEAANLSKSVMNDILDDFSDSIEKTREEIEKSASSAVSDALNEQIYSIAVPKVEKALDTLFLENKESFVVTAYDDLAKKANQIVESLNIDALVEKNLVESLEVQKKHAKTVAQEAISQTLPERVKKSVDTFADEVLSEKMNEMFIQLNQFAKGLADDTILSAVKEAAIQENLDIAKSKLHKHFTDYTKSVNDTLQNMLPEHKTYVSDREPKDAANGDIWYDVSEGDGFETRVLWDGEWLSKKV